MKIRFKIPGKPRGKERARSAGRVIGPDWNPKAMVTVHSDPAMVEAEKEIARLYRLAAGGNRTLAGPVHLHFVAVFDIPTAWPRALTRAAEQGRVWHQGKPDLDNIEKLICDALNRLAWADDSQVAMVTKAKRYGRPARVEVMIEPLAQEDDAIPPRQRALEADVAARGWDAVLERDAGKAKSSKAKRPSRGRGR